MALDKEYYTNDIKCNICGENYSQKERDEDYPKIPQDMQFCGLCIEDNEDDKSNE